jgi:hypothetical protein
MSTPTIQQLTDYVIHDPQLGAMVVARTEAGGVFAAARTYSVRFRMADSFGNTLSFADFEVSLSLFSTTTPVPTLSNLNPSFVDGVLTVTVTLPAGTYVPGEVISVTVAPLTLPDGRIITPSPASNVTTFV